MYCDIKIKSYSLIHGKFIFIMYTYLIFIAEKVMDNVAVYKVLASLSGMFERPPIRIWSQEYTGGPTV